MLVSQLELRTDSLGALLPFYTETLGLPCLRSGTDRFQVQAGDTLLSFRTYRQPAYYHFAFNIPFDRVREAQSWLAERVDLLSDEGQVLIEFPHWQAQSLYFLDPAGNILEFIGRRPRLRSATLEAGFSPGMIENISEVGLPVADVAVTAQLLEDKAGVPPYSGSGPVFRALGDPQGLFIVVDAAGKTWYPTDRPAKAFPLRATFMEKGKDFTLRTIGSSKPTKSASPLAVQLFFD